MFVLQLILAVERRVESVSFSPYKCCNISQYLYCGSQPKLLRLMILSLHLVAKAVIPYGTCSTATLQKVPCPCAARAPMAVMPRGTCTARASTTAMPRGTCSARASMAAMPHGTCTAHRNNGCHALQYVYSIATPGTLYTVQGHSFKNFRYREWELPRSVNFWPTAVPIP